MDEKEITSTVDDSSLTTPQSSNIVDRILQETTQSDFAIPKTKTIGDITKEYQMYITPTVAQGIVDRAGLHTSAGEQTAAAIKNVLVDLSATGDKARIAVGNIANLVSGGNIGEEWQNIAFENLGKLYEDMAHREGSVGGITSNLAQLAAGATSFMELALVGLATAGYGSLAQIAVQTLGEGAYNDIQAYIDENGSAEGYRPEGSDVALNIANTLFQVGSEAILGVGSPRFFTGWSRGLWKEGVGGFVQEFSQGLVNDLFEAYKGNKTMAEMLDNADQYLRDGIIGAVLQGGLGAATYGTKRARSDRILAHSIAQVRGHQTPTKEDNQDAKAINDAKERAYMTGFTEEFKKRFDATSPVGQLQKKIATAINDAYKAGKIDFGGASETQIAQKIEAFAAQETLNAMEDSAERKQSIGEHELNSIVFKGAEGAKEGELWLAGLEPEVGERSVDLAKVLEYRQSGLAEINAELEVLDGEIKQLRKQLAETTVDVKEAQKELLKEQIKKKEGQAEAKRLKKSQLEASNARLYASIEKMSAPKAEKASEQKSLKAEREQEKAVKEQRKQAREKKPATSKKEETKTIVEQKIPQEYDLSQITTEDLNKAEQRKTSEYIAKRESEQPTGDFESWAGKTNIEVGQEKIDSVAIPLIEELGKMADANGVIFEGQSPDVNEDLRVLAKAFDYNTFIEGILLKYDIVDEGFENWLYDTNIDEEITVDYDKSYKNNLEALIDNFKSSGEESPLWSIADLSEETGNQIVKAYQQVEQDHSAFIYIVPNNPDNLVKFFVDQMYIKYPDWNPSINPIQQKPEQEYMFQSRPDQSRLDKGDTYRGAYDEKLKRIILNEKSDLTTIQHEFAHYWIQNNFRWYRSGLASDDWKRNWERVEQALGIEPTDKYLSKVASEKFARAYERYIMEGKVAPEYQWAFAEFQEFYNEVYEDLEAEYFDLNEELSPELIDWFNRQRPVAPEQVAEMRQNQVRSAIAQSPDNTIIESVGDGYAVVEENKQGEIESTIVVPKETVEKEKFGVAKKMTESGLQESLRKRFGDDVNVDELVALDSVETLAQAESIIASNPQLAWEQMLSDSTNDVKRAYLYKAFAKMAENDPQIAVDLSNTNMAQWAREKGQAIQALNINDDLGLSPHTILAYMQNAKGKMSQEQLAQALNEIDLYAELSAEDTTSLENETECLL